MILLLVIVVAVGLPRLRRLAGTAGSLVLVLAAIMLLLPLLFAVCESAGKAARGGIASLPGPLTILMVIGHLGLGVSLLRRWRRRHAGRDEQQLERDRLRGRERVRLPPRGEEPEDES